MAVRRMRENCSGRVLFCFLLGTLWDAGSGQIRYSVPEEMEKGFFVGNVAKDLGLEPRALSEGGAHIVSRGKKQLFALNVRSGSLVTADRIDREELCGRASVCIVNVEILLEDKVKIYGVEVEITDVNDNFPGFETTETEIKIIEKEVSGTRFLLPEAFDPDVGMNSLQNYQLSPNHHFSLHVQKGTDEAKYPELVLERALDREEEPAHHLTLTAFDGGDPVRSGTAHIRVTVLDANDNAPVFAQSLYTVSVPENVPVGTLLLTVNATDPDEGINGKLTYFFRKINQKTSQVFQLNSLTGAITVLENLDCEESSFYDIDIEVRDGPGLLDRAKVLVKVLDVNDNAPDVTVTSVTGSISENSSAGSVIALFNVHDRDSGENGQVTCSIPKHLPFKLEKSYGNYYSLMTDRALDREQVSIYNITVTATDGGNPPLSTDTYFSLHIEDTNDNPPVFVQTSYSAYVMENNPRGSSIYSLTAHDSDIGENGHITYSITDDSVHGAPLSSYVSINSETGVLYALCSFDYEQFRELKLGVIARDSGEPPLGSNVSLTLFILDQNDNAPEILYPAFPTDGSTGVELAPRSAEPGYLVTKVVAVDGDSGQNAWLSYHLIKATEPGLFSVGLHSGEIRTARAFVDKDALKQNLVMTVIDNGEPPLSATVSVTVAVADTIPEILSDLSSLASSQPPKDSDLTLYLVIAVASVSCLFFFFIIILLGQRLYQWQTSKILDSTSGHFQNIPVSEFVGIDGVRAFLQSYSHEVSLTTDSKKSQVMFTQPNYVHTLTMQQNCEKKEALLISDDSVLCKEDQSFIQQAPPNTDWRFSQAQRPGTSGSQNGDEGGTWPNNQFDTEMLQAMILASANEAADGSSTLGGGAGTMGLSARYGPQFTLQHVPDYRQNVYIPGSTATLANAAGKRDGKATAGGNGNKKKSGKKEKK
ncbi:protocadherin gamma-A4-like isoform X6 [Trichosurus vulpecula]|uniref:protocadherin gamma-A4-like isoform X6 n=1 Tax=Trichosurus vulpecula TaxID=9337 RepID=UPI00186B4D1C|nr:protocadherin gamma-A4-like isoform X6 [Trichosurus vulpecula]